MSLRDNLVVLSLSGFISLAASAQDGRNDALATNAQEHDFRVNWINDSLGCNGFRMAHVKELNNKANLILGQPYYRIIALLGKPSIEQTSNYEENIIIYNLDCSELSIIRDKFMSSKIVENRKSPAVKNFNVVLIEIRKGKCKTFHVIKS